MRKLSKSVEEYLASGGWSSSLFFEHAKFLFNDEYLNRNASIEVGRSVVYVRSSGKLLKVYVHHNGRNKEYLSLVDEKGDEVRAFHYTARPQEIMNAMFEYFRRSEPSRGQQMINTMLGRK